MSLKIEKMPVSARPDDRTYYDRDPRLQPFRVFIVRFRGGLEGLISFAPWIDGTFKMMATDRNIEREANRIARELTRELRVDEAPLVTDEEAIQAIGTIGVPEAVREYICVLPGSTL